MDYLTTVAARALAAWTALSLLQQGLVGAIGLALAYWLLGAGFRSARRVVLIAVALVAVMAAARIGFPDAFCAVHWPPPVAGLCGR